MTNPIPAALRIAAPADPWLIARPDQPWRHLDRLRPGQTRRGLGDLEVSVHPSYVYASHRGALRAA